MFSACRLSKLGCRRLHKCVTSLAGARLRAELTAEVHLIARVHLIAITKGGLLGVFWSDII